MSPAAPAPFFTTTLNLGDIVITGYASDDPDVISILLLTTVDSGTQFTVTDEGWLGAQTGFRGTGEGETTLQFNSTVAAGTQIKLDFTNGTYGSGITAVAGGSDTPNLSATGGDSILIYNGGFANRPTSGTSSAWITGFQMNGNSAWDANATDTATCAKPTVLTDGDTSLPGFTPEVDNAVLNNLGAVTGTPASIRSTVYTASNWTVNDTAPPTIPGTTTFTVVASTTTTVLADDTSAVAGQLVTFNSEVSSGTPGTITGTVQIKANGNNIGSPGTLSAGPPFQTAPTYQCLMVGSYTITAVYSGDSNYATSTGTMLGSQSVATPSKVLVDDSFAGSTDCQDLGTTALLEVSDPIFNRNAFATIATGQAAVTPTGTVFVNAGTYAESFTVAAGQVLTLEGDVVIDGNLTLDGTLNVGTHTLTLNGAVSGTGTLNSAATGTVIYGQALNGQNVLAANYGNLTFSNFNKTLPSSGTIGIAGAFTPGTATGHTITGSTIEYNGSSAQTLPSGFLTYNNLTLNNPAGTTGPGGLIVSGTLKVQAGTFSSHSDYADVVINLGATLSLAADVTVSGNWTNNNGTPGSGLAANGFKVTFDGTTNQTIRGTTSTTFAALQVSNTGSAGSNTVSLSAADGAATQSCTSLSVTSGVFDQGTAANSVSLTTTGSGTVASVSQDATWQNFGAGDLSLSGDVSNAGTIQFNGNGTACNELATNDISITSTGGARTWSGTGTFSMTDVSVSNQSSAAPLPPIAILVNSGTDGGSNTGWIFVDQCTAGTYTWIGGTIGANTDWQVGTNWNPTRSPAPGDVLIFDGTATSSPTVTNVPTQTISSLQLKNTINAVKLNAAALGPHTLTITGNAGLDVQNGSRLELVGGTGLTVAVTTGSGSTINGAIALAGGPHRLTGENAGQITFSSTGSFTAGTTPPPSGFTGNPFGTGTTDSVRFQDGSHAFFNEGSDPFGTSGGVVSFSSGSNQEFTTSTAWSAAGRNYGILTLAGSSQTYFDSGASTEVTVKGNLTIAATNTLKLSNNAGGDLNLWGNFTDNGTFDPNIPNGGRTVKFQGGSATQTITKSSTETFFDVLIAKTGGSVVISNSIIINGALLFNGTADVLDMGAGSLQLNGTVGGSNAAGALKATVPGASLSIGGTGALGTLRFVSGSESVTSFTVNRTSSGSVVLGTNLNVGDAFLGGVNLTNGVVDMGSNTLSLAEFPTMNRTNGYVIGNVRKTFGATGAFNFAVGTANGYSPVGVNVTGNTFPSTLTVKAVQGQHPNITGTNALQRYWTLTETGDLQADLTFNWRGGAPAGGDVVGTESSYKIFKYNGSFTEIEPSSPIDTVDHKATLNGVSEFSDWTLAEPAAVEEGSLAFFDGATSNVIEGNAGPTIKTVTVTRSGGTDGAVSVQYQTSNGTATLADNDYVTASGTLSWADGEGGDKSFDVTINGDTTLEPTETINITLSVPTGGVTLAQTGHIINVVNDDAPDVTVNVSPGSVFENGVTPLVFTFTRSDTSGTPPTVDFTVGGSATFTTDYTQTGATSYTATTGSVTFTGTNATATVSIFPSDDPIDENPDETVTLTVVAGTGYNVGSPSAATGTITDDDATPVISIDNVTLPEGNTGTTPFTFTVSLSNPSSGTITVDFLTADGPSSAATGGGTCTGSTDYVTAGGTVTFNPGQTSNNTTIVVSVCGEFTVEPDEVFVVNLTNASSNSQLTPGTAGTGIIQTDDFNPDYTVTTTGNAIVVTDISGNSDGLTMSEPAAGSIKFAAAGRYFSVDGAPATANDSGNVSLSGVNSVTVNQAAGNDSFFATAFTSAFPSLTVNGGVGNDNANFNGNITFAANANLDVNLQDDDPTPGIDNVIVNAALITSGTGTIDVRASEAIAVQNLPNGKLQTENGALTVEANQQAVPNATEEVGVVINGGIVQSTGSGNISITGKGGSGDYDGMIGVQIAGQVTATSTGTITVVGTGGAWSGTVNSGQGNAGVVVDGGTILSASSAISVTGTGGTGSTDGLHGVYLTNSGKIQADGAGTVTINGNGGATSGGSGAVTSAGVILDTGGTIASTGTAPNAAAINITAIAGAGGTGSSQGFRLDAPATITTVDGTLTIDGTAGSCGIDCLGFSIRGNITASGAAAINLNGTGGSGGTSNVGANVRGGGVVSVFAGNLTITGTGGAGADNLGFSLGSVGTGQLLSSGAGQMTIIADSIAIDTTNGTVNANSNGVTLRQKTNGVAIALDGADAAGTLGLTDAELDRITAGALNIGDVNSGAITFVAGAITRAAVTNVALRSGGNIHFANAGIDTGGGTLLLSPGATGYVEPATATEVTTSPTQAVSFSSGSDLRIFITNASTYQQFTVVGNVNLTGADLVLAGTYPVNAGDTFKIVDNDGSSDPITGEFNGLPEGTVIPNFLGSQYGAQITYGGGDGNDVVLTVVAATVSVAVSPTNVFENGATNLDFTFTRSVVTSGDLTVNFTVGGTAVYGTDYTQTGAASFTTTTGTVTFSGSSTTATVTVDPTGDTDYEFDETVVLTVAAGSYNPASSPNDTATGTILNDDDTIIVTKTADTNATCLPNDCSLREAITLANANPDFNNIVFDVSGAGCVSGVCTIQPGGAGSALPVTPLPAITTQVVIDGYSQPGSSVTLSATSIDAVLGIEIDGSAAGTGANGLVLDTGSDFSTIMGLVINRFDGSGIKVTSNVNEIIGNFIGTNAAGTAAAANHVGIYINNSSTNVIGCTIPSERNLISGNTDEGIEIYGVSPFNATLNFVQGNFIGTDKTGLLAVGNGGAGVKIYDGSDNFIGVDTFVPLASAGNVISGNGGNGVEIAGGISTAINNTVYGNRIGTDLAGAADIGNTGNGVAIYNAGQNKVGHPTAALRNVITNNDKAGVLIEEVTPGTPAARDAIRANSIYNNGALGIDLTTTAALPGTGDGVTANDAGDGDAGANLQQNFPVITTADVAGTSVSGTLDSALGETFTIDVFDNAPGSCDASGNGEGKTYLGSTTAVEGAPGQYTWSLTGLTPLVEGRVITATATDSVGNTSEFSKCFGVFKRVQFAQANTNDNETHTGSHAVNIVVTRTGGSGGAVDVNYTITDGSATTGDSDYSASPSSGSLHWDDGDTTPQNIVVTVNGDNKYEIDEIVNLTLFSPVGAILGTPSAATLTIVNDDAPPTLAINDRSINEGTTPPGTTSFIFTVTKTGSTALTATVNFATADDTGVNPATSGVACLGSVDYQSQNNSLSFAPNETTKTITVLVCKDTVYEANETFQVNLSGPGNATISDDQGLGTILNDDAPSTGYVVNTTADTDNGVCEPFGTNNGCSLREAINAANTSATPVGISFELRATDPGHYYYTDDGSGTPNGTVSQANIAVATTSNDALLPANKDPDWPHGWWSIATTSALPTVVKTVVIDGYSQIIATPNDGALVGGTNAVLRIEINGANAGPNIDGLTFGSGSSSSIPRGLVINRFLRDSGAGTPAGNGINVTSGSAQSVNGNFIGTDVSGLLDLGNGGAGVACTANNVTIGGASDDAMNLISGNAGDGVAFSNSNSDVVQNNLIGTMANGVTALGNGGSGISFAGAGSLFNTLGGVAAVEGNTIRGNGADGVRLFDAGVGNGIRGNSIYANGSTVNDLGIDLGADGVTANDALDGDTGPNALQNFPVITSAIVTGSTKTITGTLNSTAGATFEIDFYASASCDTGGGNGEGQVYLGSTSVTTDGSTGDASFTFHPTSLTIGQVVTATATSTGAQFNTSEFSACAAVVDGSLGGAAGDIQFTSATYTVNENEPGGMAAITLTRVGGTNGQIQTTFHTTNGSATAPDDYTDSTQTVVFNEGETSKTVNVTIINDSVYEGSETVNLSVDSPPTINAAQRDTEIFFDPHAAVLTITDNDPVPSFSITASVTNAEGNAGTTNFDFVITKTGATAVNAQVSYTTADQTATGGTCGTAGVDYASQALTQLTFLPSETMKTVTIQVCGEGVVELDETFLVNLSNPVNATISSSQGAGTITNDDCPPSLTVNHAGDTHDSTPGDGVCLDSNQNCTLRAAIEEANALVGCAATIPINFAFSFETIIVLPLGELSVEHNVSINGPTTYHLSIDGNGQYRAFNISSDNTVSISNLTITDCVSSGNGGGILNNGTLTLNGVLVNGNTAVNGGGIASTTNNSLTLINTTISGNNSSVNGGGLYNDTGVATLTNVTIAYNTANSDHTGSGAGGGIFVASGDVTLHNTIVADNVKGLTVGATTDDISGNVNAASSYNVIGTGSGGLINGGNNNQVGVASALLKPLQENGGPTRTHALTYNSPAVDTGDACVLTGCSGSSPVVTIDQRGKTRTPLNDGDDNGASGLDIGAYERQVTETRDVPFGFNSTVDIVDAIITFPCVQPCVGDRSNPGSAQRDTAVAPAFVQPTVSLTSIDPAPLNSLSRPPNLVIGNSSSPALPAFEVTTTASYTPPATVCFYLPSFTNPTFFAGLKVLHREAGPNTTYGDSDDVLVDVTRTTNPTDFANKLVCSEVSSFSAFVIAHTAAPTAANGAVSGQIVDSSGKPVEGAAVRMTGTQNRLTITDAQGNYHFDDVEINGLYVVTPSRANFGFSPAQRSFSQLGSSTEATFTGAANGGALNPLDTSEYFVRQQYVDFLGREPDEAGFNFWVRNIDSCGISDFGCREVKRIDTSVAFFLSIEFQQTGYLIYRTYQAAYGDMPGAPVPLRLNEFKPDTLQISNRVVVLQDGWQQRLENNKKAFMEEFVQRRRFVDAYPVRMSPTEFVDKLFANAEVPSTDSDYTAAIGEFGRAADTSDVTVRARALRRIAENSSLTRRKFNQAFVLMEYFGYLDRDPNTGQDTDFRGYNFWLDKLNLFDGNFRDAEMVKAFLSSIEYRGRFPH